MGWGGVTTVCMEGRGGGSCYLSLPVDSDNTIAGFMQSCHKYSVRTKQIQLKERTKKFGITEK